MNPLNRWFTISPGNPKAFTEKCVPTIGLSRRNVSTLPGLLDLLPLNSSLFAVVESSIVRNMSQILFLVFCYVVSDLRKSTNLKEVDITFSNTLVSPVTLPSHLAQHINVVLYIIRWSCRLVSALDSRDQNIMHIYSIHKKLRTYV